MKFDGANPDFPSRQTKLVFPAEPQFISGVGSKKVSFFPDGVDEMKAVKKTEDDPMPSGEQLSVKELAASFGGVKSSTPAHRPKAGVAPKQDVS